MSPFVFPLSAITRAHETLIGSVALWKGTRRFCQHCSDHCPVLMLTCRNSPLWQRCERCNNVLSSFGRRGTINWTACHHVTCALIGTSRKFSRLQLYQQPSALNNAWVRAGRYKPRYPKGWSRTCYQECGCHLKKNKKKNAFLSYSCNDSNDLFHTFFTLACPSAYCANVSQ